MILSFALELGLGSGFVQCAALPAHDVFESMYTLRLHACYRLEAWIQQVRPMACHSATLTRGLTSNCDLIQCHSFLPPFWLPRFNRTLGLALA
jgi:hypothetical protein